MRHVRSVDDDLPMETRSSAGGDEVPHIRQRFSWDCGLTCAEMALSARGRHQPYEELQRACQTESIWSIDLAFLLHDFGMDLTFCTTTMGVRPEYTRHQFYKEQLEGDSKRVNELFRKATSVGVDVQNRSVSQEEIVQALGRNVLVLVLVDKRLLRCVLCEKNSGKFLPGKLFALVSGFLGHYVILYKFDEAKNLLYLKDPACRAERCAVTRETLDAARKSFGTDEDILFLRGLKGETS